LKVEKERLNEEIEVVSHTKRSWSSEEKEKSEYRERKRKNVV
jgi:hypothetical protein